MEVENCNKIICDFVDGNRESGREILKKVQHNRRKVLSAKEQCVRAIAVSTTLIQISIPFSARTILIWTRVVRL